MANITTRAGKGSALTHAEMDANFNNLNNDKAEVSNVYTKAEADANYEPLNNDLYEKSNILGTVSQSGGVPTGAIIERGSNANGEYVKYADGTLICTHLKYSGSTGAIWTFPVSFSTFDCFLGTPNTGAGGGTTIEAYSQTYAQISFVVHKTGGAVFSTPTFLYAVGRWY